MGIITSDSILEVLVCVTVIVLTLYAYVKNNFSYWKKRGVKEMPPNFLFGNVAKCIFAKQTPGELIEEIYCKNEGEKFVGFYVFNKPYLLIRDPELIQNIFIKDFDNFSNKILSGNNYDPIGSKTVFLVHNPPWKYIRHKLTPTFTPKKLKNMFYLMLEICEDFQTHLDDFEIDGMTVTNKVGKPVDVKELCQKFVTDVIGTTAFGLKLNSLKNPNADFWVNGKELFQNSYSRYLEILSIFFVPQLRFLTKPKFFDKKGTAFLKHSFYNIMNERRKTGIRRNDFIDLILDLKKQNESDNSDAYKMDDDELIAQEAGYFTAGFETTSNALSLTMYELANDLEVQTKLRNEILTALEASGGKITYEMVISLPYLDMVVHETLRLHPTLPWLDRLTTNDYTIPGTSITITKGTPFILPMKSMHVDPKYHPDPEKFDPERFSEENKKNQTPLTYYPFGEGPRNCIGGRLGLIQVKIGLICTLQKYEVTTLKETPDYHKTDRYRIFLQIPNNSLLNFRKIC